MSTNPRRAAEAARMRHYRARTGRNPTARVDLARLGALLERLDDTGRALASSTLGDDLVHRARAAHEATRGQIRTGRS